MTLDPRVDPTKPEPKETVQLAAVPPWAIELTRSVKEGFRATEEHFDRQDLTLKTLGDNDLTASARMAKFEVRLDTIEERQNTNSIKVRGVSVSDQGQDMQIASLAVKVDELGASQATQLAILTRLDKITSNPTVKVIAGLAGTAIIGWLSARGLK